MDRLFFVIALKIHNEMMAVKYGVKTNTIQKNSNKYMGEEEQVVEKEVKKEEEEEEAVEVEVESWDSLAGEETLTGSSMYAGSPGPHLLTAVTRNRYSFPSTTSVTENSWSWIPVTT